MAHPADNTHADATANAILFITLSKRLYDSSPTGSMPRSGDRWAILLGF
jgi:hypothetical protein